MKLRWKLVAMAFSQSYSALDLMEEHQIIVGILLLVVYMHTSIALLDLGSKTSLQTNVTDLHHYVQYATGIIVSHS